jgi:hypothetical protein
LESAVVSDEANNSDNEESVIYKWRYDTSYYKTVVDRHYEQLPIIFRLPVRFGFAWLVCVAVYISTTGAPLVNVVGWATLIGVIMIPLLSVLTKRGILLRFRLRKSFGSDALFTMNESGVSIRGISLNATYPWSIYSRGVRFPDGILLLRRGAIRWLPDMALQKGTAVKATQLVRSHLKVRLIEER